jgi:DNA-binding NarL/FixJ family response regulator
MDLIVVTPVRILGEGLAACFATREGMVLRATVPDLSSLGLALETRIGVDVVLVDTTQRVNLEEIRVFALEHASISFVALGLLEQPKDVVNCGRAGFSGYVSRAASFDQLCQALSDVVVGRLSCSAEVSGNLLRALFRGQFDRPEMAATEALTRREGEVLHLIGSGLSNKEIARELELSVATVKHHVRNVLKKLQVGGRVQAMRRVRDAPWIATSPIGHKGTREGSKFAAIAEPISTQPRVLR